MKSNNMQTYSSKRFIFYLFLVLTGMSCIWSCTDRYESEEGNVIPTGYSKLTLTLPVGGNMSRATQPGTQAEDQLNRANLFIFKDSVLEKAVLNIENFSETAGRPSLSVLLETGGRRNVYLVANTNSERLEELTENVSTERAFNALLTDTLNRMAAPPFIMSGGQSDVMMNEGEQAVVDLQLERLVSRFSVRTDNENLKIESAAFTNAAAQTAYFFSRPVAGLPAMNTGEIEASSQGDVTLYSYGYYSQQEPLLLKLKGTLDERPIEYTLGLADAEGTPLHFDRNRIYTVKVSEGKTPAAVLVATVSVKSWNLSDDTINLVLPEFSQVKLEKYNSVENTTTFAEADSLFETAARGDELEMTILTQQDISVRSTVDWIIPVKTGNDEGSQKWVMNVASNSTSATRVGIVTLDNGITQYNYKISQFDLRSDRYLVFVVAGQSNAVGYDESPKYPEKGGMDEPTKGTYQLGIKDKDNLKIIDLLAFPQDLQDMSSKRDARGVAGTKGIHLPLAQLLLKEAPAGYNILVIPNAYGGSAFSTTIPTTTYNAQTMKPNNLSSRTRWGVDQPYYLTMIDRLKYVMAANPDNKFIGVIWCQGEDDMVEAADNHFNAFSTMTESFFAALNNAGLGSRCPRGKAGKHLWYNYSTTPFFYHILENPQGTGRYANAFRGSSLFGGYKAWNPDTFIHVPEDYNNTNYVGGTGQTWNQRGGHYGNNAYRRVIAPLVMDCIRENGGLVFDGSSPSASTRFTDTMTASQAMASTGSLSQLQSGLMIYLPLDGTGSPAQNMSPVAANYKVTLTPRGTFGLQQVNNLPAPDGRTRSGKVLKLDSWTQSGLMEISIPDKTSSSWTLSFMLKRMDTSYAAASLLKGKNGIKNKLYVGFKRYDGESCGGNVELTIEPSYTDNSNFCGTGRLLDADKVRSYNDWIHYAASFNKDNGQLTIYMNGQNVFRKILTGIGPSDISGLVLNGFSDGMFGVNGYLTEFYLWDRVVSSQDIYKNYIMSYFGVRK